MVAEPPTKPTKRELAYNEAASRWLRATRKLTLDVTQKVMVARTGIDQSTLSRAERDDRGNPKNLDEIIDAYAHEVDKTPQQARREIIQLMFPESDLAASAEALADDVDRERQRRRRTK